LALDNPPPRYEISAVTDRDPPVTGQCAAVKDHTRSFEEFLYVYPVISRRSRGLSIGVNLNPDKVCNFDCIYCEVDRRTPPRTRQLDTGRLRQELVEVVRLVRQGGLLHRSRFSEAKDYATEIRDIAFSGDGEPTMVPNFAECARLVAEVRTEQGLVETKIVLITDAAGLDKLDVRRGLEILDRNNGEIWGKLDAGTEAYFKLVNRSHIRFERILKNLTETARARPIVIQSLFLRVHGERMPDAELAAYCERLREMLAAGARIKEVHAYTVARPTPEPYATALPASDLESIADVIRRKTGLTTFTFA
jgi:wyosine [tRNA(Phe)-imidazoG37] synthetase (radical SAM superfamily)